MDLNNFEDYWFDVLRPEVEKSIENGVDLAIAYNNATDEEEKNKITTSMTLVPRRDWVIIFKILEMIFHVETAITKFHNPSLYLYQIYNVLIDETYYEKIFKHDMMCDEVINYKELAKKIKIGLEMLD